MPSYPTPLIRLVDDCQQPSHSLQTKSKILPETEMISLYLKAKVPLQLKYTLIGRLIMRRSLMTWILPRAH